MKKSIPFFLAIAVLHFSVLIFPGESSQCRSYLNGDLTDPETRRAALYFIEKIKNQEDLYLKSSLYPDVRQCFGRLQGKLGDYFFSQSQFGEALKCFDDADMYSGDSFGSRITICRLAMVGSITAKDLVNMNEDEILESLRQNYKKILEQRMSELQSIDTVSKFSPAIIENYVNDQRLAEVVKFYTESYAKIQKRLIPQKGETGLVKTLLQKMNRNHPIKSAIYEVLIDYFNQWSRYHSIKPGTTYPGKKTEYREKYKQLLVIRVTAQSIQSFGINKNLPDIDIMTRAAKTSVEKWKVYEEVDAILTKFEKNAEAGVDDLLKTKRDAFNAAVIPLQKELRDRLVLFDHVPEKISIKALEDFLSPRWGREDRVVRILKEEFKNRLLSTLDRLMKVGGKSLEDVRKPVEIAERYEFFFKEKPPLGNCLSLLEKYYLLIKKIKANKKESYRLYPQLLDFFGSTYDLRAACSGVSQMWYLKKDKKTVLDNFWQDLLMNHFVPVLGDKGKRKEEDFIQFEKNVYPVADKYFNMPRDWQSRYELLKAFFWSANNAEAETAALNLCKNFPLLAQKYSIPGPKQEKKPADEEKVEKPGGGKKKKPDQEKEKPKKTKKKKYQKPRFSSYEIPQSTPSRVAEADLVYLKEMHEVVKNMITEQDVVDYITKHAPLRIRGVGSAETTLDKLFHWYNKWSDFKYFHYEFEALDMIGKMHTMTDNPGKQNEVYMHILKRFELFKKGEIVGILNTTRLEEIDKTIKNNKIYLKLFDTWTTKQRRPTFSDNDLDSIDKALNYELLTLEQAIQAHYMLGQLNERRKGSVVPECYHYGTAYLLMKLYDISKIRLVSNELIERGQLKEKVCVFCTKVKNNDNTFREFDRRYKNKAVDIEQLIPECKKILEKRYSKKEMPMIKFMEDMFEYIKTGKPVAPQLQDIYKQMMEAKTKSDFSSIKNNEVYKNLIPTEYDFIMNNFFQLISSQEVGWKEKAKLLISVGDWPKHIADKMSKILEEIQKNKD